MSSNKTYSFEEKYNAMLTRDAKFEGIFITAVKTTGIFCRPVCNARKPKRENVIFFDTADEAITQGFRACRICKPLDGIAQIPVFISSLIDELSRDPALRIKDADLHQRNINPYRLRRWFKKNYNMSFQSYQRMMRINSAFQKLNGGDTVTATAFDSGYGSVSGFNERFRSVFGTSPSKLRDSDVILVSRLSTPLGAMFACATSLGICLLEFLDRDTLEAEFLELKEKLNAVILPGENDYLRLLKVQLKEYFDGKRKAFNIPLHTPGTPFQIRVWDALQQIPFGETTTYGKQANAMVMPKAVRAIASANRKNRISILVPCHRVIAGNGDLAGYGGGLPRKKWLIEFEASVK